MALLLSGCGEPVEGPERVPAEPDAHPVAFERIELGQEFFAEGAAIGDLDGDGAGDVVAGPYWYRGPDFQQRFEIYPPAPFDVKGYSDNFFAFLRDLDSDGWTDVLVVGFPGQEARWYRNPGEPEGSSEHWERFSVFTVVDNEAPWFTDLTGDGVPELVFNTLGQLGWAEPDADPTAPWVFSPLSDVGPYQAFTHGLGVGDLTGDGRPDVIEATGYFEQPESLEGLPFWTRHDQSFGAGGAQMFAYDVDGDGDQDVITSLSAHGYGVSWFERQGSDSAPSFVEHVISGPADGPTPLHEPHALDLSDVNGDGLMDIVTGERFWGHVPAGDPSFDDPALLYWFELRQEGGSVSYVPHLVDDASGVGTDVTTGDLNGDGRVDIVVANKKGTFVFLQRDPAIEK